MGFSSVYRCLQDVFPQIDARVLKAVAIEHSKDVEAAVNDILTEVIPYMNGTHSNSAEQGGRFEDSASRNGAFPSDIIDLDKVDDAEPSSGPKCAAVENFETRVCTNSDSHDDLTHLDEIVYTGTSSKQSSVCHPSGITLGDGTLNTFEASGSFIESDGDSQLVRRNTIKEKVFPNELEFDQSATTFSTGSERKEADDQDRIDVEIKAPVSCDKINGIVGDEEVSFPPCPSTLSGKDSSKPEREESDCSNDYNLQLRSVPVMKCEEPREAVPLNLTSEKDHIDVETKALVSCDENDGIAGDEEASFVMSPSIIGKNGSKHEQEFNSNHFDLQLRSESPVKNCEKLQEALLLNCNSENDHSDGETGCLDEDFTRCSTVTQSVQISSIDFLDEILEAAKNNKKTLFSGMESIMNMMKEVELQERAAERAKEEAAIGGLDILVKVEELKQMLAHAKEANDMHAGEVYGEKAILATEVRELQFRLLSLSDERDKSLATLDEMRQTLEERLAAAEEMKTTAEQEKLKKEESAQRALAEQEAIMEKLVLDSQLLEQEAELNAKLREFLVDRGSIVDVLQGEISVICQDVSLLKEKFDNRVPLSMSISSSQTTCRLASSGSSLKSVSSVIAPEERESAKSPESRIPDSLNGEIQSNSSDDAMLDGWDIFDKDAEMET